MHRSLMASTAVLALLAASPVAAEMYFNRIASFSTSHNMAEGEDTGAPTSPEIVDATGDGMTLVYTDSPLGALGLVDITDPAAPKPLGNIALEGEPNSVKVIGQTAYVAINTSESYTERDNQLGETAVIKKLYRVPLSEMTPVALGGDLPVVSKEEAHDFLPDLKSHNGFVLDKIEGFTVDAAGNGYAVTDNDGVDDSSGETYFWSIGQI